MEAVAQMSPMYPTEGQFQKSIQIANRNRKIALARAFGPRRPISRTRSSSHWSGWTGLSGPARISAFLRRACLSQLNYTSSAGTLVSGWLTTTPGLITRLRTTPRTLKALVIGRNPFARTKSGVLAPTPLSPRNLLQLKTSEAWNFAVSRQVNMLAAHLQSGRRSSRSATVSLRDDETKVFPAIEWLKPRLWALRASENEPMNTAVASPLSINGTEEITYKPPPSTHHFIC